MQKRVLIEFSTFLTILSYLVVFDHNDQYSILSVSFLETITSLCNILALIVMPERLNLIEFFSFLNLHNDITFLVS